MSSFKNRITVFSFILTILVIWIHAVDPALYSLDLKSAAGLLNSEHGAVHGLLKDYTAGSAAAVGMYICFFIQKLFGFGLGQIAVPGFFALSGYLFFRNADIYHVPEEQAENKEIIKKFVFFRDKWKKRFYSLILPFILWNGIYYIIYVIAGKAGTDIRSLAEGLLLNKYNPVFWYLRELIIITFLTPVIYFFLNKRYAAVPVLLLSFTGAVFYDMLPVHIVNEDALFYYMTGAAVSLHAKTKIENPGKKAAAFISIISVLVFAASETLFIICAGHPRLVLLGTIAGRASGYTAVFSLISLLGKTEKKYGGAEKGLPPYMKINFFVYALHYLEIRFFRLLLKKAGVGFILTESIGFLIMPALCIAAALLCRNVMKKTAPVMLSVLTGGRDSR